MKVSLRRWVAALIPVMVGCFLQGVRAADNDTAPAPASFAPGQGEIRIDGSVQEIDAANGKVTVLVTTVTLPGKAPITLNPARKKRVAVAGTTTLLRTGPGTAPADVLTLKLGDIKPDTKLTVVGKDTGVGMEVPARVLAAIVPVPAPPATANPPVVPQNPNPPAAGGAPNGPVANPQAPPATQNPTATPGAQNPTTAPATQNPAPAPAGQNAAPAVVQVPDGPPATPEEAQKIRDAIFRGDTGTLTEMLDQEPSLVKGPYPRNDTPVHQAIFWGKAGIVDLFLKRGASLEVKNGSGQTPLMTALAWGKTDMAKMLIDRGADINTEENDGKTPLGLAREKNMADLVTLLEGRNAIAEGPTRGPSAIKRGAPLFEAVQKQDTAAVRALLAQDRTLANARNGQGETPLIADIFWGNVEIAHALVDAGTDVNAISDWGDTALKKAQFFHKDEIAALLQAHGAK